MTDQMHQPRGENGQYVSVGTLFERERLDHKVDHDRERQVARETAQRLEREVEETAKRLERSVEETALRLEKAVEVALRAVAATAVIHAEAHGKEHTAHERIHTVEKSQVDKAEQMMNKRLEGMNEFRAALTDQANKAVTRELFDAKLDTLSTALNKVEKRMAYYAGGAAMAGFSAALLFRLLTGG